MNFQNTKYLREPLFAQLENPNITWELNFAKWIYNYIIFINIYQTNFGDIGIPAEIYSLNLFMSDRFGLLISGVGQINPLFGNHLNLAYHILHYVGTTFLKLFFFYQVEKVCIYWEAKDSLWQVSQNMWKRDQPKFARRIILLLEHMF